MGGDIGELGNRSSMVTSWIYKAGKGFAEGVSHISLPPWELRLTVRRTNSPQNPKPTDQPSTSHSQTFRKESTNGLEKIFKTDIFLLNYLRDNPKAFKVLEKQLSAIGCNLRELRVDVSFIPVPRQAAVTKVQLVGYSENVNKLKEVLQDYQMNQIEHLQNVHLQCIYEEQKIHISDKIRQARGAGEKLLYHETTQDSCDSSMTTGFNSRFAGQNGGKYIKEFFTDHKKTLKGNHSDNKVNLVLLGMSGTGKSASGNTILGKKQFLSRASSKPITTEWQVEETEINGTRVCVIDTPDIFNDEIKSSVTNQHVTKCKQLLQSGPCVFLPVLHICRFTDGERDTLRKFEEAFGIRAKEQTIILFTRGEELQRADMNLEGFLQDCNTELENIVEHCGGRCVVFENKAPRQHQVTELMQTVSKMLNKYQNQ